VEAPASIDVSTSYAADDTAVGVSEETHVLSQEHPEGVRSDAGNHRDDDPTGHVAVPEPRSPSAARLLEMTARDTDQWRADARAEATNIVAAAREEAVALVRSAEQEAASMVETARLEAARTLDEAQATAEAVRTEADRQRAQSEAEVARLQQVAADHAQHLRQHLNDMLGRLDSVPAQTKDHGGDDL
jgi:cell division septum initiation protein DivIVA